MAAFFLDHCQIFVNTPQRMEKVVHEISSATSSEGVLAWQVKLNEVCWLFASTTKQ